MKFLRSLGILFLALVLSQQGFSQIGKLIKDKAKKLADTEKISNKFKEVASIKLADKRDQFDSTNFNYAISLNDNTGLYDVKEKGEGLLKLATNLKAEKNKTESEKARGQLDLGETFYASGNYRQAELTLLKAKLQYETNNLTDDINYPKVISNIGLLYGTMGRYTSSEEYNVQALDLYKEKFGEENTGYGAALNNLGVLYKETGRYSESEQTINSAIQNIGEVSGKESMPYAIA